MLASGVTCAEHLQVDLGGGERLAELVVQFARNVAALLFLRGLEATGELPQTRIGLLAARAGCAPPARARVRAAAASCSSTTLRRRSERRRVRCSAERQQPDGAERQYAEPRGSPERAGRPRMPPPGSCSSGRRRRGRAPRIDSCRRQGRRMSAGGAGRAPSTDRSRSGGTRTRAGSRRKSSTANSIASPSPNRVSNPPLTAFSAAERCSVPRVRARSR